MESAISYINDRGEYKVALVPAALSDDAINFDEGLEAYTYVHPIFKTQHLLHSLADRPALVENDDRRHWLWRGRLHRLTGPAFICGENEEWYAFGVMFEEEEEFNRCKEYMLRVEAFAHSNGIDLHGCHLNVGVKKHFIDFKNEQHILDCAESGIIPICDRETGEISGLNLDEIIREVHAEERGPGLLITAVLGAAAALAASKIKSRASSAKKAQVRHTVAARS